jgi:uncharacterized protein YaeQ
MLMQNRLCRLALTYSNADHHCFVQQQFSIPPYREEDSTHYAKRLLTLTALVEQHPAVVAEHTLHKSPDFQIQFDPHYRLWAQVDIPDDRHLKRACHKSDCVLLCSEMAAFHKFKEIPHHPKVVCALLDTTLLCQVEQWIKPSMHWSVWRDGDQLQLTDGQQVLEYSFPFEQLEYRLGQIH